MAANTMFERAQERLDNEARQIDAAFRVQRKQVLNDYTLSDAGKREKLRTLEADRVSKVAALQEKAAVELTEARTRNAKALHDARRQAEEAQRAQLGDVVMLQLLERRIARLPSADVVRMVKESASDWQRAITLALAGDVLDERQQTGALVGDEQGYHLQMAYAELSTLQADARPAELVDLERQALTLARGQEWVETLDLDKQRRGMAAMGISYESALNYADTQDAQPA